MPPPRAAPTLSSKLRNRAIHSLNGNSTSVRTNSSKRRRNSLHNLSKRHKTQRHNDTDKENRPPVPKFDPNMSPRRKPFRADNDSIFALPKSPQRRTPRKPTKLERGKAPSVISISSLLEFQQDANLSDRQMIKMVSFIRQQTDCVNIIEPYFEIQLTRRHQLFADHFISSSYSSVTALVSSTFPLVICDQVDAFFEQLQDIHKRKIVSIHHGVDSGKGFLKFDLTVEFDKCSSLSLRLAHMRCSLDVKTCHAACILYLAIRVVNAHFHSLKGC